MKNGVISSRLGNKVKELKGFKRITLKPDQKKTATFILSIAQLGFYNKDMKYISKEKAEELKYHSFKSGDIVLAKLGDPIGKTCTIPKKLDFGIVVADVVRIRPSEEKADYKFIEFLLNSNYCSKQLSMRTIGSTRPRVNLSHVRNLKIILNCLIQ